MTLPESAFASAPLFLPAVFLAALLSSLLLVPLVRRLSFSTGRVSQPRKDRWHSRPTPTLGGIGMFVSFAVVVLASTAFSGGWGRVQWGLLAGSALMFALGLLDDFRPLSPPAKLVGQFFAAAVVIYFGRTIDFFPWAFANVMLTFFWLVGITNAINLLDNMDGLAGGVSVIAAGFLAYFFWRAGSLHLAALALALAGGALGFLVFNFPPARIFMGDSGSMFLGFTLAALAVAHRPRASDVFTVIGVPTLLLLLPILDTTLVTITRLLRGQSPAQGGADHTSHRLIAFGLSERQAVLALYGIGIVSGVTGAVLEALDYDLSLVLIPIWLISLAILTAYLGGLKVVSARPPAPGSPPETAGLSYAGGPPYSGGSIIRFMAELTYKRRIFEILLDFFLLGLAYYLAFWTHQGFNLTGAELDMVIGSMPIALASGFVCFFFFGIYRGLWRYIGFDDLLRYLRAALITVLLTFLVTLVLPRFDPPPVVYFLYGVFLFLGLSASRASFRMLDHLYRRQSPQEQSQRVLIYGAGDAGVLALQWLQHSESLGCVPVGFLDPDSYKWGRRIHGLPVLGGAPVLEKILASCPADGLIITTAFEAQENGQEAGQVRELVELCRGLGLWVKVLRLGLETLE